MAVPDDRRGGGELYRNGSWGDDNAVAVPDDRRGGGELYRNGSWGDDNAVAVPDDRRGRAIQERELGR